MKINPRPKKPWKHEENYFTYNTINNENETHALIIINFISSFSCLLHRMHIEMGATIMKTETSYISQQYHQYI